MTGVEGRKGHAEASSFRSPMQDVDRLERATPSTNPLLSEDFEKSRWISLYLVYFIMFIGSVGFSVSLPVLWPFLERVGGSKSFLGFIVASFSIGQMVANPIFGFWSNKSSASYPLAFSMFMAFVGNVMFCFCDSFKGEEGEIFMLVARTLTGFGGGNAAVCRAYIAGATTTEERTKVMACASAGQGLGFIVGPAIAAVFVPLNIDIRSGVFVFDYLTQPSYFSALINLGCAVVVLCSFVDVRKSLAYLRVTQPLLQENNGTNRSGDSDADLHFDAGISPSSIGIVSCLINFFGVLCVFATMETIATPMLMDEYSLARHEADFYVGFLFGVSGVVATISLVSTTILIKHMDERKLLVVLLTICMGGLVLGLPFGDGITPCKEVWCWKTPQIPAVRFVLSCVIVTFAYAGAQLLVYSIFSKVLGPSPQGVMMGLLAVMGSLARIVGPVYVTNLYVSDGPFYAFLGLVGLLLLCTILVTVTFRKLKPHPEM
eukprot:Nk52_evm24s2039 gene=Nk52_evmTU24s2039